MHEYPLSENHQRTYHTKVKIKNKWLSYGLMNQDYKTPYPKGKYLGSSREIMIDGSVQKPFNYEYHFWKKTNESG
jgi:hypothetical protein